MARTIRNQQPPRQPIQKPARMRLSQYLKYLAAAGLLAAGAKMVVEPVVGVAVHPLTRCSKLPALPASAGGEYDSYDSEVGAVTLVAITLGKIPIRIVVYDNKLACLGEQHVQRTSVEPRSQISQIFTGWFTRSSIARTTSSRQSSFPSTFRLRLPCSLLRGQPLHNTPAFWI